MKEPGLSYSTVTPELGMPLGHPHQEQSAGRAGLAAMVGTSTTPTESLLPSHPEWPSLQDLSPAEMLRGLLAPGNDGL